MTIEQNNNTLCLLSQSNSMYQPSSSRSTHDLFVILENIFRNITGPDDHFLIATKLIKSCILIKVDEYGNNKKFIYKHMDLVLDVIHRTYFVWKNIYAPSYISLNKADVTALKVIPQELSKKILFLQQQHQAVKKTDANDEIFYIDQNHLKTLINIDNKLSLKEIKKNLENSFSRNDLSTCVRILWSCYVLTNTPLPEVIEKEAIPLSITTLLSNNVNDEEVIRFIDVLLESGCNVEGYIPLSVTIRGKGRFEVNNFSCFSDITYNQLYMYQQFTPLSIAILFKRNKLAKQLIAKYGTQTFVKNTLYLKCPFIAACNAGNIEMIQHLMKFGHKLESVNKIKDLKIETPLTAAISYYQWDLVNYILEKCDTLFFEVYWNDDGVIKSYLHVLISHGNPEYVQLVLSKAKDLKELLSYNTKKMIKTICNHIEKFLNRKFQDKEYYDCIEKHPLIYAAKWGKWEIVDIFLRYGMLEHLSQEEKESLKKLR